MNRCTFMGNITHDLEVKRVGPKQTSVLNFSIAVSRKYKNAKGETVKDVVFVPLEAWDSGAETIARHFKKGKPIIVHCSFKMDKWVKDEVEKSAPKFRVNEFDFVPDGRRDENAVSNVDTNSGDTDGGGEFSKDGDDDIPF